MERRNLLLSCSFTLLLVVLAFCACGAAGLGLYAASGRSIAWPTAGVRRTPTAAPPSPSPTGTATPAAESPHVLRCEPASGSKLADDGDMPADQPLVIVFDQPMDRASVERALRVEPPVNGRFVWAGDSAFPPAGGGDRGGETPTPSGTPTRRAPPTTFDSPLPTPAATPPAAPPHAPDTAVAFVPDDGWRPGTSYTVTLGPEARSLAGARLASSFRVHFTAVRLLRVLSITPADGAQDVAPEEAVEVQFDQPVVDLSSPVQPSPLQIQPPVDGEGTWIDAQTYHLPAGTLQPATRYTVILPQGLRTLSGALLPEAVVTHFETERPRIVFKDPISDEADPGSAVWVQFSLPMESVSTEAAFSFTDLEGHSVRGTFDWPDAQTFTFTPAVSLRDGQTYQVSIDSAAMAQAGPLGLPAAVSWQFTVAAAPQLISSSPADGVTKAEPTGKVRLNFNVALDRTSLEENLSIEPQPEEVRFGWAYSDRSVYVYFDADQTAEVRLLLSDDVRDIYGRRLTGNRSIVFQFAPLSPSFWLSGGSNRYIGAVGTYVGGREIQQFFAARNLSSVHFQLYAVEADDFLELYSDDYGWPDPATPGKIDQTFLHAWDLPLDLSRNVVRYVPTTLTTKAGDPLPDGIYRLEAEAEPIADAGTKKLTHARWLIVSRANLALKWGSHQVFAWATDLTTGQVIPDMTVEVRDAQGQRLASGRTNEDGVFVADLESPVFTDYWRRGEEALFAVGHWGDGLAFCASRWNDGISIWNFGLPTDDSAGAGGQAHVYTDRPIYRPDQLVHFKGIVRTDDDGRYHLPEIETVPVTVRDSYGNELFSQDLPLSEFGTFYSDLHLDETAPLGYYEILTSLPGRSEPARATFQVAEYRKPEFQVRVTADRDHAVHGETISVTVQADYYFGAPVANAPVRWAVYGSTYQFRTAGVGYSFGDYDEGYWYWGRADQGYNPPVHSQGEGFTDDQGRLSFELPIDLTQSKTGQLLSIEASLEESNGQQVTGRTVVLAHKTDLYLGVRSLSYVADPEEAQQVEVIALSPFKESLPNVPVTAQLIQRRWDSVQRQTASGSTYWENAITEEVLETQELTTGPDGKAIVKVTPPAGGTYKVLVTALDGLGNEAQSSTYFWAWGRGYINWGVPNNDRIPLVADKQEYEPGDTAKILVAAPFDDYLALITVERGGVISYTVQRVAGTTGRLELPITADYAPNAFVSISLLKTYRPAPGTPPAEFKLGYTELKVKRVEQELQVTVAADKERYEPGDTAIYTVQTHDHTGQPVSAELSLGLVDAAVLALTGDVDSNVLDAFYYRRGLGVWNAQTLVINMDRINLQLEAEGKGGGGGGEGIAVRRDFADTAYWNPVVVTGRNGRATVRVTLPDNLTTWRMRAKGITVDTKAGTGQTDVIATQSVLVRPVLPRFLAVGDQATLAALVHNYTDDALTLEVTFQAEGLKVEGSQELVQMVTIEAGDHAQVAWEVETPKGRQATVFFQARAVTAASLGDAVEMTLPIHAFAEDRPLIANQPIKEDETFSFSLTLPADADPDMDELVIETTPSLAAGIRSGLEYLTGYPYG
jgi:hypothetical protein